MFVPAFSSARVGALGSAKPEAGNQSIRVFGESIL
jgi:hypothetical protein